jgi:hypothetical protein
MFLRTFSTIEKRNLNVSQIMEQSSYLTEMILVFPTILFISGYAMKGYCDEFWIILFPTQEYIGIDIHIFKSAMCFFF